MGRPPHSQQEYDQAKPRIREILQTFRYRAGRGTVEKKLPDLSRRVISYVVKLLKAEHKAEEVQHRKQNQIHVNVLAQGALMAQDSTHTGSFKSCKAWAEVAKDAATTEGEAFGDGKPVTGAAMVKRLETLKAEGRLPLALATDNGPAYKDSTVADWLHQNQVIHLFSRPHTPQDNGRAERGIGEGKAQAGLGKGVDLPRRVQGVLDLAKAYQILNKEWPRRSKGGFTAVQLKQILPHWQTMTTRDEFYTAATRAIKRRTKGLTGRALRRETREAIFRALEKFGLILRTRGEHKIH